MQKYSILPKNYIRSDRYRLECDMSGELSPEYEHQLAGSIEDIVLKYFETQGEPYYGAPVVTYNSFKIDYPYTFAICADPPRSYHYPVLFLKPDESIGRFKSEIDNLLDSEGFSKFRVKMRKGHFSGIEFEH